MLADVIIFGRPAKCITCPLIYLLTCITISWVCYMNSLVWWSPPSLHHTLSWLTHFVLTNHVIDLSQTSTMTRHNNLKSIILLSHYFLSIINLILFIHNCFYSTPRYQCPFILIDGFLASTIAMNEKDHCPLTSE